MLNNSRHFNPQYNPQCIALYTLVRREMVRMLRISSQVFLPPVISTALYFLIFGSLMGPRIGLVHGIPYTLFIAPGLIMMSVITNAYANVSTSLFSLRFQRSIEEILVSPMSNVLFLTGYVLGGVCRGMIVALLVFIISCFFVNFFVELEWKYLPLTILVLLLVSSIFSLAGFINGMVARTFDDVALVPTFVLAPLTYLGGVFYSLDMLSPFWHALSQFNPIVYMINALRFAMVGQSEVSILLSMSIIIGFLVLFIVVSLILLKKGTGFKD